MLYYLVDALPAFLGSMATLWAVCSPRHWFVRSSFLGALLLLFLLIPAYELLVAGCVQIAVIWGGITWWRKRRNAAVTAEPWRVSLRNLLLSTVLAAVAMAVLASFPESPLIYWLRWTWPGFVAGCVTLFGVWLVVGQTRWLVRWSLAVVFVSCLAAAISLSQGISWFTRGFTRFDSTLMGHLLAGPNLSWMGDLFVHYLIVIAIGIGSLCLWIQLFVKTGWFDPFGDEISSEHKPKSRPQATYVRAVWIVLTVAIASFPLTLLVKLALPIALPDGYGLKPKYFENLNDAGKTISDADNQILINSNTLKHADLGRELEKHAEAVERMRAALKVPMGAELTLEADEEATDKLLWLVWARSRYADQAKDVSLIVESRTDEFLLLHRLSQDATASEAYYVIEAEFTACEAIWNVRADVARDQLSEILTVLQLVESDRKSWERLLQLQRIEDENAGWESHLHVILDDWLGNERYAEERVEYHTNRTKIRLMLLDLALLSFQEAHGRLPDTLAELVPDTLEELPSDPYADGPLRYLRTEDSYKLYSVGPNKIDERGEGDDMTLEALMQPTIP